MKTHISIISLLLLFALLFPSCTGSPETPAVTTQSSGTTEGPETTVLSETTTEPEPDAEKRYLIDPYIDIEFTADGGFSDEMLGLYGKQERIVPPEKR